MYNKNSRKYVNKASKKGAPQNPQKTEAPESNVIVSFLGMGGYNEVQYQFADGSKELGSYSATALYANLKADSIKVSRMVVFGTTKSAWDSLVESVLSVTLPNTATAEDKNKASQIKEKASKIVSDSRKSSISELQNQLNELENQLNELLKERTGSLQVSFKAHNENIASSDPNSAYPKVLKIMKDLLASEPKVGLYLDVTNGLRLMPMLSFFAIQTLSFVKKGLKLKGVYYAREPSSSIGSALGPDRDIFALGGKAISKFRNAAQKLDDAKFEELVDKLKDVLPATTRPQRGSTYKMCSLLGCDEIYQQGMAVSRYDISGSIDALSKAVTKDNDSVQALRDISTNESLCYFKEACDKASSFEPKYNKFVLAGMKARLEQHLALLKPTDVKNSAQNVEIYDVAKRLAVMQFECGNYFRSLLSFSNAWETEVDAKFKIKAKYSALNQKKKELEAEFNKKKKELEDEFYQKKKELADEFNKKELEAEFNKKKKELKDEFNKKKRVLEKQISKKKKELADGFKKLHQDISDKRYKDFQKFHRAMFLHLQDKHQALNENCLLSKLLKNDRQEFYSWLQSFMADAGCKFSEATKKSQDNALLTFLGSGTYDPMDYKFIGKDNLKLASGSLFLGNSLAEALLRDNKINRYIVAGTRTSDWILFFTSLELTTGLLDNKSLVATSRKAVELLRDGSGQKVLTSQLEQELTELFASKKEEIGFSLEFLLVEENMTSKEDFYAYFALLEERFKDVANVWLDLTHSFRSLTIAACVAMNSLREEFGINIAGIYYGVDNEAVSSLVAPSRQKNYKDILGRLRKQAASNEDKEKTTNILENVLRHLEPFPETLAQGMVLDMKILDDAAIATMSLAKYEQDMNLRHLLPLFVGDGEQISELRNLLMKGADNENLSFWEPARKFLNEFLDKLYQLEESDLPLVLRLFKDELSNRLIKWIKESETWRVYLERAALWCDNKDTRVDDIYLSACYLYQFFEEQKPNVAKLLGDLTKALASEAEALNTSLDNLQKACYKGIISKDATEVVVEKACQKIPSNKADYSSNLIKRIAERIISAKDKRSQAPRFSEKIKQYSTKDQVDFILRDRNISGESETKNNAYDLSRKIRNLMHGEEKLELGDIRNYPILLKTTLDFFRKREGEGTLLVENKFCV